MIFTVVSFIKKCSSILYKASLIILVITGSLQVANAAQGCRGISSGDLYTVSTADPNGPGGVVWLFSSAVKNPQNIYCLTASSTACTVRNGTSYYPGAYLVDYVPIVNCSLDAGVWALFASVLIAGIYFIRFHVNS